MAETAAVTTQSRAYEELSGAEQAAVVLLALGRERAEPIVRRLDERDVHRIGHAMSSLGTINFDVVERALGEFAQSVEGDGSITGGQRQVERFFQGLLPEDQVQAMVAEANAPGGESFWQQLSNTPDNQLFNFLSGQHPQAIAVVLSSLESRKAGRVLNMFSEDQAHEIALRITKMDTIDRSNRQKLEAILNREFLTRQAQATRQEDGSAVLARILNNSRRARTDDVLNYLDNENPRIARRVRGNMFTFEDLMGLEAVALRKLIGQSDGEDLAKALANGDEETRKRFLSNMSERGARGLKRQLDEIGRVRRSEQEQARTRLIETARALANQGEITLSPEDDEDDAEDE